MLSVGRVLARAEDDVVANRVRQCIGGKCALGRALVGVHADGSKIVPEPRLHEYPRPRFQWRARCAKRRIDGIGHVARLSARRAWRATQHILGLVRARRTATRASRVTG